MKVRFAPEARTVFRRSPLVEISASGPWRWLEAVVVMDSPVATVTAVAARSGVTRLNRARFKVLFADPDWRTARTPSARLLGGGGLNPAREGAGMV